VPSAQAADVLIIFKKGEKGMEYENKYGSKGATGAALGLAIAGTTLGVLGNRGGLGNVLGGLGGNVCNEDHCINRYEFGLQQEIAAKDSKIALLESNIFVDSKLADVYEKLNSNYEKLNTKIGCLEAQQAVVNAQITANISCLQSSVMALQGLTKTIIPITNICPEPAVATTTTP
jgi:hypothetical protein